MASCDVILNVTLQVREIRGGSILFDVGSLGGSLLEVVFISDVRVCRI